MLCGCITDARRLKMEPKEKWNKLCDYFERYKYEPEEKIQKVWETLFSEIFGYSFLDNEIESHRKIQLGSTERLIPDIIIKNNEIDLFMVELKREDLPVDEARKKQLYSYLKQEHNDLGILVCNQICLIKYDYSISDENQVCCYIDFKKDNPLGIKFIEIFEKGNFTKEKAMSFILESNKTTEKIESIKQQLTVDLLRKLIIEYFSKIENETLIKQILDDYSISISRKEKKNVTLSAMAVKHEIETSKNHFSVKTYKSDKEKLLRDIRSVGMETFIKYFEYYNNSEYETSDIKSLFRKYENFSENSMASKASTGKGIIKRGYARDALEIIMNATNIDDSLRAKAKEYYEQI